MTAYDRLTARFARIATIREAASILNWDTEVIMPPGAGDARADQAAVLSSLSHGMLVEPAAADDLADAEAAPPADPWQAANLRLMRHEHTRAVALPAALVEATARASSLCEQAWRDARKQSDFAAVAPLLREVVDRTRDTAQALAPVLGLSPYDALMDDFQPGVTAADVAPVFARYGTFLADALPRAEAAQAARPAPRPVQGHFPEAAQARFCRSLSERMGLDFRQARLDSSAHPFSGGTPTDQRITTRYDEADVAQALYAVIHETGHALYETGLPAAWRRQPVGHAAGMAAHESQSLIVEMQACRSDAFLSWLGPALHAAFGGEAAVWAPTNLASLWRKVARSFIRVEADEMTYPAHVALRFTLEQAMIAGDLAIADLPGAWNGLMRERLGIVPPDDARGCLQDIHWYAGLIGYFPSYTLGAMAAAQLMAAARRDTPGLDEALAQGDFAPLFGWLRPKVHAQGALRGFNDLLRHATGKPLDSADFEAHLTRRYLG
ncbi:MAG TPA: carboxypeptidase M32 [Rhodopila sp.]|uniref:carboxypeptidase M32 n=1 Tax=Rhodopila sp. TaxID=2480087 RepID=UPI002CC9BFE5|nr:carboxypeptidase M32 [Rhodopila sp.]HVY14507.1 carboxypeptidase M32 [Rhodopila sp.]